MGYLTDIDELLLKCRSDEPRQLITEAVACYKAGAFRAAIVSAWIAVLTDFTHKLRELDARGDHAAQAEIKKINSIHTLISSPNSNNNKEGLKQWLDFEREVLELAKSQFEMISQQEYEDLQRLAIDRNRCAHAAMNEQYELYLPPAESARLHIRNAIEYMLQHPPAQGKKALEDLIEKVKKGSFPDKPDEAYAWLKQTPLGKPRKSLLSGFVDILVKILLKEPLEQEGEYENALVALQATINLHPISKGMVIASIGKVFPSMADIELWRLLELLGVVAEIRSDLEELVSTRLNPFLRRGVRDLGPVFAVESLVYGLEIPYLKDSAYAGLLLTSHDVHFALYARAKSSATRKSAIEACLDKLSKVDAYSDANELFRQILKKMMNEVTDVQMKRLIQVASRNSQVRDANGMDELVSHYIAANPHYVGELKELAEDLDLTYSKWFKLLAPEIGDN